MQNNMEARSLLLGVLTDPSVLRAQRTAFVPPPTTANTTPTAATIPPLTYVMSQGLPVDGTTEFSVAVSTSDYNVLSQVYGASSTTVFLYLWVGGTPPGSPPTLVVPLIAGLVNQILSVPMGVANTLTYGLSTTYEEYTPLTDLTQQVVLGFGFY